MPDPRLRTILEGQLTNIETNANAWNLPTSEFEMPELLETSTPSSPYECHSPSPLMHAFTDVEAYPAKTCATSPSTFGQECDVQCAGSKRYPPEHSLHHRRRWSIPSVKKEVIVNVKEVLPSPEEHTVPTIASQSNNPISDAQITSPTPPNSILPSNSAVHDPNNESDTTAEAAAAQEAKRRTSWARAMILSGPDDCEQLYAGVWERQEKWLPLL
ncbi:hypothetical protein MMC26_003977 [Xylographa opegraphella]|nr:hypothetical protein [Xylographa opegraphella]